MRYFIPASERQGSCYFEFQPGRWRGRGLAAGLLRAATELLQAAGLPRICGETRLSNEAMRRTFASCGYRLTCIEEDYYDHPPESACKFEKQFEK